MTSRRGRAERTGERGRKRERPPAAPPRPALPPMTHGPLALAAIVAAMCIAATVTSPIHDPDIWQHLAVGRTIWQTHAIPTTQIWTWPTYGAPDVLPSWLFRALLWPVWEWGGVHGLFAWRWVTTLGAFALAWLAARRMGATGVAPLLMLVWCALFWRQRSQVRPETFAGLLLVGQILLLEIRRARARQNPGAERPELDLAWGVVPIALLWANAHISYYLGFIVSGGYLLDDLFHRRRGGRPGMLALAILAAAAASFVNPFGWRALAQPIEYFTVWRHEPVYKTIGELDPIYWDQHVRDGLPAWLVLVVVAALVRWRRGTRTGRGSGFDWAQAVLMAVCLPQALLTQRFLGYAALALAPFAARDAAELLSGFRWPAALHAPLRRALIVALASAVIIVPTLAQPLVGFGYGWVHTLYPERATQWIEDHDVRGRGFNVFWYGGYLLHRFHPDRDRLPFMDIHQAGTPEIRELYAWALQDSTAWRVLDQRFRFDWVLLTRVLPGDPNLADFLDVDRNWALVFVDDVSALWLRRDGRLAALAEAEGYRFLPAGKQALGPLGVLVYRDSTARAPVAAEIQRAIASSPWNARSHTYAGNIDMLIGRFAAARGHYEEAVRQQPLEREIRARLGLARLYSGDAAGALEAFRAERRRFPDWPEADLREGQALAALGRTSEARKLWERSVAKYPQITEAADSLRQ